eukprot:Pgem_evm1s10212
MKSPIRKRNKIKSDSKPSVNFVTSEDTNTQVVKRNSNEKCKNAVNVIIEKNER